MLQPATIKFLKELKKNNHREWFEANRKQYEFAKDDFAVLVQNVIDIFSKKDTGIASLKAKDCVFRINRDVRFSKDKSPYKTNMGASFSKGGKKSPLAGYYFHCEPGNSFVGGGLWMPEPDMLAKLRQEIDYNFDEFKKITGNKKFVSIYKSLDKSKENSLVRPPKGYEADNRAIEYIKLKSFIAMTPITDAELINKNLIIKLTEAMETLQPVISFINRSLED
ncbi:MAG TPA: DUF2461 domain-containing protein [Panacibacter sp.]|nr:DUF2461 domain-containing protein [Panacibacter sp.]